MRIQRRPTKEEQIKPTQEENHKQVTGGIPKTKRAATQQPIKRANRPLTMGRKTATPMDVNGRRQWSTSMDVNGVNGRRKWT